MIDFITSLLCGSLRISAPIMIAALGQIFVQSSGTLDLSVEGTMVLGCFTAFTVTFFSGSLVLGLLASIAVGIIFSSLFAYLTVTIKANQVIAGTAMTILGQGFASFLYREIFGIRTLPPIITNFPNLNLGFLSRIPIIGQVVFGQNIMTYLAVILIFITSFIINKTYFGLTVKGVGEYPRACDAKGIAVNKVRFETILIGGVYSSLAGAAMSLGFMNTYTDNMIAGRGFMAIAVVVFARWRPKRVFWAALLFGFASSLQMRFQSLGVALPKQLLQALPYILTIVVLLLVSKHVNFPAAFCTSYDREES